MKRRGKSNEAPNQTLKMLVRKAHFEERKNAGLTLESSRVESIDCLVLPLATMRPSPTFTTRKQHTHTYTVSMCSKALSFSRGMFCPRSKKLPAMWPAWVGEQKMLLQFMGQKIEEKSTFCLLCLSFCQAHMMAMKKSLKKDPIEE